MRESDGTWRDATEQAGMVDKVEGFGLGVRAIDFDNDGDLDLVMMNGHIYPQVDEHPEVGHTYRQQNHLFENRDGAFVDVTGQAGPGFQLVECSRGVAAGDYDNDGDIDLLISNLDAAPNLLRNDSRGGAWLTVVCETEPGDGPVIGTHTVRTDVRARQFLTIRKGS